MPIGGGRVQRHDCNKALNLPKTQRQARGGLPVRSRRTKRISDLVPCFPARLPRAQGVLGDASRSPTIIHDAPPSAAVSPAIVMLSRPLAPLLMMDLAADVNQDQLNHLLVSLGVIEYSCTILSRQSITCQHRTSSHPTLPTPPCLSYPRPLTNYPAISPSPSPKAWETINFFYFHRSVPLPIPLFTTNFPRSQELRESLHRKPLPRVLIVCAVAVALAQHHTFPFPASYDATFASS